jgi:hypothetical protein
MVDRRRHKICHNRRSRRTATLSKGRRDNEDFRNPYASQAGANALREMVPDDAERSVLIQAQAQADGVSLKLVICCALGAAGIAVAAADFEDLTPRRRVA